MISLDNLIRGSKENIKYNPLKGVDALKRDLTDHAKFLAGIAGIANQQDTQYPLAAIRNARTILEHLHFGFIVHCDQATLLGIREKSELTVTSRSEAGTWIAVVSGSLAKYKAAATEVCIPTSPFEIRYLFDELVMFFEKIGLQDIFFDYRKVIQRDGSFLLEHKG